MAHWRFSWDICNVYTCCHYFTLTHKLTVLPLLHWVHRRCSVGYSAAASQGPETDWLRYFRCCSSLPLENQPQSWLKQQLNNLWLSSNQPIHIFIQNYFQRTKAALISFWRWKHIFLVDCSLNSLFCACLML